MCAKENAATDENTVIKIADTHVCQKRGGEMKINVADTVNNTMTQIDIITSD